MGSDAAAYREVNECGAVVEAGVVVEQLYVAGLQDHFQAQLARGRQLVEQRHRLVVGRRQPRHLLETLTQQVVVVRVVDAQVALLTHHSILSMLIICFNSTSEGQLTAKLGIFCASLPKAANSRNSAQASFTVYRAYCARQPHMHSQKMTMYLLAIRHLRSPKGIKKSPHEGTQYILLLDFCAACSEPGVTRCLEFFLDIQTGQGHHLMVVEDGQLEVALLALGHLALAVHVPGPRQHARQVRPPPHNLVVHADGAAPAAQAALFCIAQAQQRCSTAIVIQPLPPDGRSHTLCCS